MKRSVTDFALFVLVALSLVGPGCAFSDGEPWGEARFELRTTFDADGREVGDRFRTSKNFEVVLDSREVEVGAMALLVGAEAAVDFDPANPPAGYSLCHNGHCHSDDGSLVDYEDIAADLGGDTAGAEVTASFEDRVALASSPVRTTSASCNVAACRLPRGNVNVGRVILTELRLKGRAFDTLEGDAARLPEEGIPFDLAIPLDTTLETTLDAEIGKDFGGDIEVAGDLVLSARLLDAIDFTNLSNGGASPTLLEPQLEETSRWEVRLTTTEN